MQIPQVVANRIQQLTRHQLGALDELSAAASTGDPTVAFVAARNGGWGLRLDGKVVDNVYSPDQSARKYLADKPFEETDLVVLIGCGGGSLPLALAQRLAGEPIKIAVIEPHVHVLAGLFVHNQALASLNPEQIQFFSSIQAFKFYLIDISLHGHRLRVLCPPSYQRALPEKVAAVSAALDEAVPIMLSCHKTRGKNTRPWIRNLTANVVHTARCPSVYALEGALRDVPAVLVASGPGLDRNIHHLRGMEGKALICCVNSSWPALLRHGIQPHMVFTAETSDVTHDLLGHQEALAHTTLVAADTACPKAFTLPAARTLVMHHNTYNYASFIAGITGQKVRGMHGGGCTANAMFATVLMFGCNPVALVGQDLAYSENHLYANATDYGSLKVVIEGNDASIEDTRGVLDFLKDQPSSYQMEEKVWSVRAWDGKGTVSSPAGFNTFRLCFQEVAHRAMRETGVSLVNATEGGAWIEGFDHRPLAEFLADLPNQDLDLTARIETACRKATLADATTISEHMTTLQAHLMGIAGQASQVGACIVALKKLVASGDTNSPAFAQAEAHFARARDALQRYPLLESLVEVAMWDELAQQALDGSLEAALAQGQAQMTATRDAATDLATMLESGRSNRV